MSNALFPPILAGVAALQLGFGNVMSGPAYRLSRRRGWVVDHNKGVVLVLGLWLLHLWAAHALAIYGLIVFLMGWDLGRPVVFWLGAAVQTLKLRPRRTDTLSDFG